MQLQNGKYAINCETLSSNGDFPMHYGGYLSEDAWIVLLNTDGSIDTALIYGGSGDDQISEIIELPDHDWQVFGTTLSTDFDLSSTISLGYRDGWIFKTDSNGIIKWTKRYGSGAPDFLETAKMISKYFFLTAGSTSGCSYRKPDRYRNRRPQSECAFAGPQRKIPCRVPAENFAGCR